MEAFSVKVRWIQELDSTQGARTQTQTHKMDKIKSFKRVDTLSATTCILFSGWIYGILIAYGLYEYVSLLSCHTCLF